jgi:hypothetical protein
LARELLDQRNAAVLPVVAIRHPLAGISREEAAARITGAVLDRIVTELCEEAAP